MSHPITSHDRENERVDDSKFAPKARALNKKKGKHGLGKFGKHDVHPDSPLGKLKKLTHSHGE